MDQDLPTRPYDHDDDLIRTARDEQTSRVRVYGWPDVAVVIGRGGKQALEFHRESIIEDDVTVYKRSGGGCSVVLDPGNLIISSGLPLPGVGGITSAFNAISNWIIKCLDDSGVPGVTRQGISDLTIGEKKIGGSCIYRTKGVLYYSTTLLVDHEQALVDRYLKHPPREPEYRQGRDHRRFMTSLAAEGLTPDPAYWLNRLEGVLQARLAQLAETVGCPL